MVNRPYLYFGGDKQDRTADLLHAMQALSQLSYTPETLSYDNLNNSGGFRKGEN